MQMRSWRLAFSLVVVALMGVMVARPAAAQDEDTEEFDFSSLEGIEQVVSRSYTVDFTALLEQLSTPGAEMDPTVMAAMENPAGMQYIVGIIAKFDDDGHAEDGLGKLSEEFTANSDDVTGGAELEEVDLGDIGDHRVGYTATEDQEGTQVQVALILVQKDEYVYGVIISNGGGDAVEPAKAVVEKMIDNDEGDDVEIDEAGNSTGGLWDKFPKADDEELQGLVPIADQQLYPAEETPEE